MGAVADWVDDADGCWVVGITLSRDCVSIEELGEGYIYLMLLHWPGGFPSSSTTDNNDDGDNSNLAEGNAARRLAA